MINKDELVCYWYPGKIKIKDGATCATNTYYQDQLCKDEKYVRLTSFKKYLKQTYGLDYGEYYNIVVEGNLHKEHLCQVCGKPTKFGKFSRGFDTTCSRACHNKIAITKALENPKYVEHHVASMLHWDSRSRSTMNRFITNSGDNKCSFYLAISKDRTKLKFGITKNDINLRSNYYGNWSFPFDILTNHSIIVSDAETVAKLEYFIKYKYSDGTEVKDISELSNIFKYIREYFKVNN